MSLEYLGNSSRFKVDSSFLSVVDRGEMSILSPLRLCSLLLGVGEVEAEEILPESMTDDVRLRDGIEDSVSFVPERDFIREPGVATPLLLRETS